MGQIFTLNLLRMGIGLRLWYRGRNLLLLASIAILIDIYRILSLYFIGKLVFWCIIHKFYQKFLGQFKMTLLFILLSFRYLFLMIKSQEVALLFMFLTDQPSLHLHILIQLQQIHYHLHLLIGVDILLIKSSWVVLFTLLGTQNK